MANTYFDYDTSSGIVTDVFSMKQRPKQYSAADVFIGDHWDGSTITPGDRGKSRDDKVKREDLIDNQTVVVDSMVFDACRNSQNDMARNILTAKDESTVIQWKLHGSKVMTKVTKGQLEKALALSVEVTTKAYIKE